MDYFASDRSYQMKPYYAKFTSGESQGLDAFSVSWRVGRDYFHPPVCLVSRVIRKAERERAEGVLVMPDWSGSGFMCLLGEKARARKLRLVEQFYPVLICPKEIVTDTFRGVLNFCFNVYVFSF